MKTAKTESGNALDAKLYKVYRFSVYAFGTVFAAGILGGTWFGLQMIQKHDQKYAHEQEVKIKEHVQAMANPYRNAATVEFHLPYLHGSDPNTIRYISEIARHKTASINGGLGFQVPGEYRSGSISQKVNLTLSCKDVLCNLDFKLPARMVLTPQYDGTRFRAPKRSYQIASNGYVFEVLDSQIFGIHAETSDQVAPFSTNLDVRPFYKEAFYDSKGQWIRPKT